MKKKRIIVSSAAVLLVVAAVFSFFLIIGSDDTVSVEDYGATNPYITYTGALVSAHRSGGGLFPENTFLAFKDCVTSETFETDIFEFDIHLTKDNVLILLHDDNFDRTSNSEEFFGEEGVEPSEKNFDELQGLNLGENFQAPDGTYPYRGLRGEDIPQDLKVVRLEDILDYIFSQEKEYSFIIEIKDSGDIGRRAADELYRILKEHDILDRVIAGTFNGEITEYFDEKYDDMLRSASIAEVLKFYFSSVFGIELDAEDIKYDALQIPYKAFIFNLGTQDIINRAHSLNVAVQYWTINDEEDIKTLNNRGADAIITDNPEKAYDLINAEE